MNKAIKICLVSLLVLAFGFMSGFFGGSPQTSWYQALVKPAFQPPNWIFGPMWTLIYLMIGTSFGLFLFNASNGGERSSILSLFIVQFVLNYIWSPVFFRFQMILAALVIIVALWIVIFILIRKLNKPYSISAKLLIPYLMWISFATLLNASIYYLN